MIAYLTKKTTPKSDLLKKRFEIDEKGVFEATVQAPVLPPAQLTERDKRALEARYRKMERNPNFARAAKVKALMGQGKTLSQICSLLYPHGKGYGKESIGRDYWAIKKT